MFSKVEKQGTIVEDKHPQSSDNLEGNDNVTMGLLYLIQIQLLRLKYIFFKFHPINFKRILMHADIPIFVHS